MTDDETVALGEAARALLAAEPFMEALKGLMLEDLDAMLHSDEEDAKGREKHFRSHRSLEAILERIMARVQAADVILDRRQKEADAEANDDPAEYDDILT